MSYQDWNDVVIKKKPAKIDRTKKEQSVAAARRSGATVETTSKFNAGRNVQKSVQKDMRKLEEDPDDLSHASVGRTVALRIQQGRQAKGWTQKELAARISEKAQVVNDYEAGRGIPSNQILGKMERHLGVKLRGKL